jgi:malonyl-CoA O-methyltransferase
MLSDMGRSPEPLVFRDIRRRFDRVAATFDDADFVHRATFDELLQRLSPVVIEPSDVLDLGCASGSGSKQLARRYRRSRIICLDASFAMMQQARKKRSLFRKPAVLQGDASRIPLTSGSIDLVFANMLLPWIHDHPACLSEVARVLRKDGVFAFATLGPDSLSEIREAWRSIDEDWHVNAYPDMHDIGDALVRAGLRDPVLDVDYLTVTYRDTEALYRDLTRAGARNCLHGRRRTLTGKARFKAMDELLAAHMADNVLSLKLELVYGHAWGGGPRSPDGEFRFDPSEIKRRRVQG